ncbi:MAG TPA: hypothetical protein VHZ76_06930 [Gammaproteobacteria bacterium]|jgi:hypothetical protein|nr:hypothetical protein [Gammaproteobacteria bacterium]
MKIITRLIFVIMLSFLATACSVQVSGVHHAYQPPTATMNVAILKLASSNLEVVSVDSKSFKMSEIRLNPGWHEVTLYVGKNNYTADVNHMMVLGAYFDANTHYLIKSTNDTVWIERSDGKKVSSVISTMQVGKSIGLLALLKLNV